MFIKKPNFYLTYNNFYVLQNSHPKFNRRTTYFIKKSITTYDFSTLYTKLLHDKQKNNFFKIIAIGFAFKG